MNSLTFPGMEMNPPSLRRTNGDGIETHEFPCPNYATGHCFTTSQVVRFADHVPTDLQDRFGSVLIVLEDDGDTIIAFSDDPKLPSTIPSDEVLVKCRSVKTNKTLWVSRTALVHTGTMVKGF